MPVLETTRAELHELVWSKPVRDVAKQFGMSDVGVAKLCKRNKIQRPPSGYWLRSIKRKEPPALKGADKPIHVYLRDSIPKPDKVDIEIPEVSVSALHKLVAQCRSDLKGTKPDAYGRPVVDRSDMQVSRNTLSRALAMMNQVVRTALKIGYSVDTKRTGIVLMRDGESLGIGFYEHATRSSRKVKYANGYERIELIYSPSGILKFTLHGVYGSQREWSDRSGKPLESQLVMIMRGIFNATEHQKALRIQYAKEQYRNQINHRKAQRQARIAALTVEREHRANQMIDGWLRSQEIAIFLQSHDCQELTPQVARLIRWVGDDLARHHNPLDPYLIAALDKM